MFVLTGTDDTNPTNREFLLYIGVVRFICSSAPRRGHREEEDDEHFLSNEEIQHILESIYAEGGGIDRKKLSIVKGAKCWSLFFDVIVSKRIFLSLSFYFESRAHEDRGWDHYRN